MYREITLKNNVIVLSVPLVHHTELQNFLIAPRDVFPQCFAIFEAFLNAKFRSIKKEIKRAS